MRILVLLDEDGNMLEAYGPFNSLYELRVWAETSLKKVTKADWWKYQDLELVGVTEEKEDVGP